MPNVSASTSFAHSGSGGPRGSAAQVTHAEHRGVHVLRYFGRINYMSAPAIQRFLDDILEHRKIAGLVFDLTSAEALDSTNLGLLARVSERVRDITSTESMIVSRNRDINDVLFSMGFDQSFDIVTESSQPPSSRNGNGNGNGNGNDNKLEASASREGEDQPEHDIETPAPTQAELHETMLEAHRALVRLSEAGRIQFQDVVACLESDRPSSH
jgi:anti-anti-sigma factor